MATDPIVSIYFSSPDPIQKHEREMAYRAFRSRLIEELRINGGSHEGVVYGRLQLDHFPEDRA